MSHTSPADTGVDLESYDTKKNIEENRRQDAEPPFDLLEREQTRERLRRIGRQLRTTYRHDLKVGISPALQEPVTAPSAASEPQLRALSQQTVRRSKPRYAATWGISMLLVSGAVGFCLGVGLLAWSAAFQLPRIWQWGMTSTFAAEGALILGLVWMAVRLWKNGRRVNRQLDGVDRQLTQIQHFAGSLAGSRMSSSQHYYDHFSQAASPHMLVANLRGQVDQLASQIAAHR